MQGKIVIEHIIYHILLKKQFEDGEIILNPAPLTPNESHQKFLDALNQAYMGKAGKGYGKFSEDEDNFPMPRILSDFQRNNNFYDLSKRMMNVLLRFINVQQFATGGTVFITIYKQNSVLYMLVAILSEKTAFATQDWEMIATEMLDIEHLKFAGRINLTDWKEKDLTDSEQKEKRYISFLKGKDEIAKYFKEFLSCDDTLYAQKETARLTKLINMFLGKKNLNPDEKLRYQVKAKEYLSNISINNEAFLLRPFANYFWPTAPDEVIEMMGGEDGISDGFIPDRRTVNALDTYKTKTQNWALTFNQQALNDGDIEFIDGKKIVLTNPPEKFLKAFLQ